MLLVTAGAVSCYLVLSAVVIVSAVAYVARHADIWQAWLDVVFATTEPAADVVATSNYAWLWAWVRIALWSFPQMALGLSGFEMIMTVVPRVSARR